MAAHCRKYKRLGAPVFQACYQRFDRFADISHTAAARTDRDFGAGFDGRSNLGPVELRLHRSTYVFDTAIIESLAHFRHSR